MFQNSEVDIDELPGADDLDWRKLHKLYAQRIRIQILIGTAIVAAAITALKLVLNIPLTPIVVLYSLLATVAIVLLLRPGIAIPRRGFVLRDKDILFRKGIFWRSVTAVPFNRIQHVETSSTPLDRKFGLATLQLFTAGGSSGDLKIDGLGKDIAEDLRKFILSKVGAIVEVD
jgi:membrane protein YdbS with pleckstrin-like domain